MVSIACCCQDGGDNDHSTSFLSAWSLTRCCSCPSHLIKFLHHHYDYAAFCRFGSEPAAARACEASRKQETAIVDGIPVVVYDPTDEDHRSAMVWRQQPEADDDFSVQHYIDPSDDAIEATYRETAPFTPVHSPGPFAPASPARIDAQTRTILEDLESSSLSTRGNQRPTSASLMRAGSTARLPSPYKPMSSTGTVSTVSLDMDEVDNTSRRSRITSVYYEV